MWNYGPHTHLRKINTHYNPTMHSGLWHAPGTLSAQLQQNGIRIAYGNYLTLLSTPLSLVFVEIMDN